MVAFDTDGYYTECCLYLLSLMLSVVLVLSQLSPTKEQVVLNTSSLFLKIQIQNKLPLQLFTEIIKTKVFIKVVEMPSTKA